MRKPIAQVHKMVVHELIDDSNERGTEYTIATVTPVKQGTMIDQIIKSPITTGDGRSPWCWVRLSNGDLILGLFPQGETYELATAMEREDGEGN